VIAFFFLEGDIPFEWHVALGHHWNPLFFCREAVREGPSIDDKLIPLKLSFWNIDADPLFLPEFQRPKKTACLSFKFQMNE
jgi:hypothetical protein